MATKEKATPRAKLKTLRTELVAWLVNSAYPMWSQAGIDPENGGFIETVGQNGLGLPHPRRARIHPRQIYAFSQATALGWKGDVSAIVARGVEYFAKFYLRPDGLFRTLAGVDGAPLDDRAMLYDQSFALLGYAAAGISLDKSGSFEKRALDLLGVMEERLGADEGAFRSSESGTEPFESNPHMHLLEACLAWADIGRDPIWAITARRLVNLAVKRFIRLDTGALGEAFAPDWQPAAGIAGRVIEPGHQFEWAWLMLRADAHHPTSLREPALRLLGIGEHSGVHRQVAVNALLDDFSVHDPNARFWPQTERLKAALLAAQVTADEQYWAIAADAAASLLPYLNTPVRGLWLDVRLPSGELVDSPAPASTFYHLVGAIVALQKTEL